METTSLLLDRAALADRYRAGRDRSARLFSSLAPGAYYEAPIPLRHPFVFYDGHLRAFAFLVLHERALHGGPIDVRLEKLFERGIDPGSLDDAQRLRRADWPERDEVRRFGEACDVAIVDDIVHAVLDDPSNPLLVGAEALFNILEHELMHHETLTYIIHQLPLDAKRGPLGDVRDAMPKARAPIAIPAGSATLGQRRGEAFGWDNEFDEHTVAVPAFSIDAYDVTNGDYLAFVRAGGPRRRSGSSATANGGCGASTARSRCRSAGRCTSVTTLRRPTVRGPAAGYRPKREYHRAAYGTPGGAERAYPWGWAPPAPSTANFDSSVRPRTGG